MLTRLFLLLAFAALACAPASAQVTDETTVPRISVADLKKAVDAGRVVVVDVRDAGSFAAGHIASAISITLENLPERAAGLKASKKPIVTYCA